MVVFPAPPDNPPHRSVRESLREYLRGITGGLIFSLPLLYTLEVWWAGFLLHPLRLALYVIATFVLLLGYNRYAGMRPDANSAEVAVDSVEEMGIGLMVAALVLVLLGQITPSMGWSEIIGKVVAEGMPVAIGVSVGTAQLGTSANEVEVPQGQEQKCDEEETGSETAGKSPPSFGGQVVIAICGATLFGANIAPTEEIVQLALNAGPSQLLGLATLSLLLGALILYGSDFTGSRRYTRREGKLPVLRGTVLTYAIALVVSAAMLWFYGRFDGASLAAMVNMSVVLALPAALGASGGRLLLQTR